jgi:hypothetical protein
MKKPHWTKKVPSEPGVYWYRADPRFNPFPAYTTGVEFSFVGTDTTSSAKELREEGVEFWSEKLEAPK